METNGISSNDQEAATDAIPATSQISTTGEPEQSNLLISMQEQSSDIMSVDPHSEYVEDNPMQDDEGFTGLQITNVESGSGPGSETHESPSSSYEEETNHLIPGADNLEVSEPDLPGKQNGDPVDMMDTHFDENQVSHYIG